MIFEALNGHKDSNSKIEECNIAILDNKYNDALECKILPENFDENLNKLFEGMFCAKISPVIKDMVDEIKIISKM